MKKKDYSLITSIVICFLLLVVLSWVIPTATVSNSTVTNGSTSPVGLFGLLYYPALTVGTFVQFGLMILAIGGFYGVLSKTGVYTKLVDSFVARVKGKEKLFAILVVACYAIVSSVLGVPYAILVSVPLFIAVLEKSGYSKISTIALTVGGILVGQIGSTFGYNVAGFASSALGIAVTKGVISRAILLVLITALYAAFVLTRKGAFVKPAKKTKAAAKEEDVLFLDNETTSKKSMLPMIIFMVLTNILALVSMFNWNNVFKIEIFEKFYEDLMAITVGGSYPIIKNILGISNPFGYWDSYELVALLSIMALVVGWIYSLKFKDIFEGFIEGARKFLRPAVLVIMCNMIFTLMLVGANSGTMVTFITNKITNLVNGFNIFTVIGSTAIGSFFYNYYYYLFNSLTTVFNITYGTDVYAIMMLLVQSIYGIMMMLLPTSLFLVAGLSMNGVSYKEWVKYIWKYLLVVLAIIILVGIILVLV